MGIRFYDEALLNKLKTWVADPSMTVLGPGETGRLYQILLDESGDKKIKLPIITLSRSPEVAVNEISKRPLTYDAAVLATTGENGQTVKLNAIPISLKYRIDVLTKYYEEADEYMRNFMFNLINYPKVQINIPYNGSNIKHNSSIVVDPFIRDVSDQETRLFPGQFNDWAIEFSIPNAYLFSVPFVKNWSLIPPMGLDIKSDNVTEHEEIDFEEN